MLIEMTLLLLCLGLVVIASPLIGSCLVFMSLAGFCYGFTTGDDDECG